MTAPKLAPPLLIAALVPALALLASSSRAAPPTSDPTYGIRFTSPVNWGAGPTDLRIIKYFTHEASGDTIYDCRSYSDACGTGNTCGYITPFRHDGTDIRVNKDYDSNASPVRAGAPGWVSYSESGHPNSPDTTGGYANHVIIDHGCGVQTLYGHLKSEGIAGEGAQVTCQERIGWGAESGSVFGAVGWREHTHFEIRSDGTRIDPFFGDCNSTSDIGLWAVNFDSSQCQAIHPPNCATTPPPIDGAVFVDESTPLDGDAVIAGSTFDKTWTIRNVGNQTWTSDNYRLVFSEDPDHYEGVTSHRMNGPEVHDIPVNGAVPPQAPFSFTMTLTAPETPGRYRAAWVMDNTAYSTFGDGFWVDINVVPDPNDPNGTPLGCDTSDYGDVAHGTCWQVDFPAQCGWLRCDNGQSVIVDYIGNECLGERLLADNCQSAGDNSSWAADLLVQDNSRIFPSTVFEKRWLVRNSGSTTWDDSVVAAYTTDYVELGGTNYLALGYNRTPAGGPASVALGRSVVPGDDLELSVVLVAPTTPGKYVSAWQLERSGQPFGDYLWLLYEVVEPTLGACVIEYSDSGAAVAPGECVQSDRQVGVQPAPACDWLRCTGAGTWESGTQVNADCDQGGGHRFPSCFDGDGNPSAWEGWCPGPFCDGNGGGGGGGGGGDPLPDPDPPPPPPEPDPGEPPCPCSADPSINNFCYYGVNNPECPPTQPGNYCDPNGDGSFADGNWDLGYYEYVHYCG